MALEKIGLGATITADSKPMVKAMGQARDEMGRFISTSNRFEARFGRMGRAIDGLVARLGRMATAVKAGMAQIGSGLRNLGMGLIPMGVAMGAAIKKAADFEKQMSAVSAITRATAEDQRTLEKKAKNMGIVSAFSATQAGEGMEFMARAGASTAEIVSGLDGVMNAAAADGIELAASADIVSRVVRGMGMSFDDASHIADVLALASSKSNTNIRALGESFVYGAASARQAGVSLEETVSIFGKMADAGLKGSMAGTGLVNMLGKLTKPSGKASALMKKWGISLDNADGSLRNVSEIVADFAKEIDKLPNKSEQLATAQEIFGKRGARAYGALASAGSEATKTLEEMLKASSEGEGAAAEMAAKRLDNLTGKMTLFKSSMEGLAIGVFGPLLKNWSKSISGMTDALNTVLFALEDIDDVWDKMGDGTDHTTLLYEKYGKTAVDVALGIRDATTAVGNAFTAFRNKVIAASKSLKETLGADGVRKLTKILIIVGMVAGALAPLLFSGMMLKWVFGGILNVIIGIGKVVVAAFWPAVIAIGALLLAWRMLRKENETFLETSARVWGNIKAWLVDLYDNALKPLWMGITDFWGPAIEDLGVLFDAFAQEVKGLLTEIFLAFGIGTDGVEWNWRTMGQVLITVLASILTVTISVAGGIVRLLRIAAYPVLALIDHFKGLGQGISMIFSGNVINGFKRLGLAIVDFFLIPIRWVINSLLKLMDLIPGAEKLIGGVALESIKEFARGGLSEVIMPTRVDRENKPEIRVPKLVESADHLNKTAKVWEAKRTKEREARQKDLPKVEVGVSLEDKRKLEIQNEMCIDGEGVNIASGRHKQELQERAGFKATPYQRRALLEHGAAPVKKAS